MGILTGGATRITSIRELVYSEDPDVTVPPALASCGWVPAEACVVRPGADKVTVRALDPGEATRMRDVHARSGEAASYRFAVSSAVKGVGKRRKQGEIDEWVDALAQQDPVCLDLLGRTIWCITRGIDPATLEYAVARQILGYEAPEAEGVADAGGDPKSIG